MNSIETIDQFNKWVKVQLVLRNTSLRKIAQKMNVSYPRLSEAVNGRPSGIKYIIPLIQELGGVEADFIVILETFNLSK